MVSNSDMTTKEEDMTAEQELAKYLDKYLYNELKFKCKDIKRITDKTQQIEGIDVTIEYDNGQQINIDEKAQLHYIDVCRKTFAFEIDFIGRDNNLHLGWLYNNNLKTDTYMLIWPEKTVYSREIKQIEGNTNQLNKIKEILRGIKYTDFKSVDCYLIKRNKIKEYLEDKGWNEDKVMEKARALREAKRYGRILLEETNSFYFFFSDPADYREAPINIIIKQNDLKELAHQKYRVTEKGPKRIY